MGSYKDTNEPNAVFHTAYIGSSTCHLVKHLRTQTPYTFRVCGRGEASTPWSAWSVPKIAATTILHYRMSFSYTVTLSLTLFCTSFLPRPVFVTKIRDTTHFLTKVLRECFQNYLLI